MCHFQDVHVRASTDMLTDKNMHENKFYLKVYYSYLNDFIDSVNFNVHLAIVNKTDNGPEVHKLYILKNYRRMLTWVVFEHPLQKCLNEFLMLIHHNAFSIYIN